MFTNRIVRPGLSIAAAALCPALLFDAPEAQPGEAFSRAVERFAEQPVFREDITEVTNSCQWPR